MMKCEEAASLLYDYLDRELSPEDVARLEEHLEACKDCFGHTEFDKAVRKLVRSRSLKDKLSPEARELLLKKFQDR